MSDTTLVSVSVLYSVELRKIEKKEKVESNSSKSIDPCTSAFKSTSCSICKGEFTRYSDRVSHESNCKKMKEKRRRRRRKSRRRRNQWKRTKVTWFVFLDGFHIVVLLLFLELILDVKPSTLPRSNCIWAVHAWSQTTLKEWDWKHEKQIRTLKMFLKGKKRKTTLSMVKESVVLEIRTHESLLILLYYFYKKNITYTNYILY